MNKIKVECYRKSLLSRVRHRLRMIFDKEYRLEQGKKEMIEEWRKSPATFMQYNYDNRFPPLYGVSLNMAAKVMEIYDRRKKYE